MVKIGKNAYKNIIFPILIGSCFEHNTDYSGNDVANKGSISDENDCQKECQNYDGCNYWTFDPSNQMCWMKGSYSGSVSNNNGARSGPKF